VSTLPTEQGATRSRQEIGEQTAIANHATVTGLPHESPGKSSRRQKQSKASSDPATAHLQEADYLTRGSSAVGENLKGLSTSRSHRSSEKLKSSTKFKRLILLAIASVVGVGILGFILISALSWLQKTLQGSSTSALEPEQPIVQLSQPPVPIPEAGSQIMAPDGPLTEETAQQVIQAWLSTKALALGSEHQVDQFKQILTEPALTSWQQRAETAKQDNSYWQYKHAVKVNSVKTNAANPDQARVEAAVNESAQLYQGSQLNQGASYNDNLRVRYELVRKEGRWLIKDMAVVK
jgi:hypothetical protein